MEDIEVPQYFVCPISLQIMKDPVTAITGITYDRESIEHWLFKGRNTTCPVTNQPLPRDSDLTPNHTLRRLLQAWCIQNSVDRIPTPKTPLNKFHIINLLKDLGHPQNQIKTIRQLEILAAENERNRKYMMDVGVSKAMLSFVITCFDKDQVSAGLEEALSILHFLLRIPSAETRQLVTVENNKVIESLTWVLGLDVMENHVAIKSHAMIVLKSIIETATSKVLERLKRDFFKRIVGVLRQGITQQGINAALHVLLDACLWGRNRIMMVESGAVFELIELELSTPEKRTTELTLGVLFHLCCCADGRAQFLSHRGGLAVVTKRILEVSPAADDRAVLILSLISKFSNNSLVSQEMLTVKTVEKLFRLFQYDCAPYLKDKAREILKSHLDDWKDSPCIDSSILTRSSEAPLKNYN